MWKYILSIVITFMITGCGSTGTTNPNDPSPEQNSTQDQNGTQNNGGGGDQNTTAENPIVIDNSNYQTEWYASDTVRLTANVTGAIEPEYTWKEGNTTLGHGSSLEKSDFTPGDHTITLFVDDGAYSKSAVYHIHVIPVPKFKIESLTVNEDKVMMDVNHRKMWVSDGDQSKHACLAVPTPADYSQVENFCENLDFAGFTNWRKPSARELSNFVKDTVKADVLPAYYAPCQLLIATNDASKDVAVITRYGVAAEKGALGDVIDPAPTSKVGLRCVRDVDPRRPMADAGPDITVKYQATFSFDASRSTDPNNSPLTYDWLFRGHRLSSDPNDPIYTRQATQPPADYNVTLRVTNEYGLSDEDIVVVHVIP